MIAAQQGRELSDLAVAIEATVVSGSSLKAALDVNWDEPNERLTALHLVLGALDTVTSWLEAQADLKALPTVNTVLATAEQVKAQDVEVNEAGAAHLKSTVARNRRSPCFHSS